MRLDEVQMSRAKKYRIRVRESNGVKTWWAPGVGAIKRMSYGKERTHLSFADKNEALKMAERVARSNCFVWVKVLYGKEKIYERKP